MRALPGLLAIAAWRRCDHTGPVRANDVLTSRIDVGDVLTHGDVALVALRSRVSAGADPAGAGLGTHGAVRDLTLATCRVLG